ncbi:6-pyruvoyltetrahydropterin/6-carboxytetrahydropterin synthase [Salibacterium salarium]|uniref:6-carboxytetrahydropterin synthase QueD n=1 Tax=Salibacterium salarium TaxID=284579 RepID=UPI002782B298|nr:6-carboxytetrahydropterin synthase QueD [Salibacterium salarium]MDQ0298753.1 6-pyruvoyltetrahydropterin/6-carboxytetrahydropterin synthase [Salibacterium salarium]
MIHQFYPQVPHEYRYELNKDMQLAAAHFIPASTAGKCANVHGHTYVINVTIAGDHLNETGFLVDFKTIKNIVHDRFDHSLLNEDEAFGDTPQNDSDTFPTTEVVARTIWQLIQRELDECVNKPRCLQVLVRETPTSYVVYRAKEGDFDR